MPFSLNHQLLTFYHIWFTREKHPHLPSYFLLLFFAKPFENCSSYILVNIYSAYIDNFLNAKDAVRVAKEARPAFLKFLEVPGPGRGMEATLLGSALGVSGAPSLDPRALACGSISPLRARGAHWGPVPGRFHLC